MWLCHTFNQLRQKQLLVISVFFPSSLVLFHQISLNSTQLNSKLLNFHQFSLLFSHFFSYLVFSIHSFNFQFFQCKHLKIDSNLDILKRLFFFFRTVTEIILALQKYGWWWCNVHLSFYLLSLLYRFCSCFIPFFYFVLFFWFFSFLNPNFFKTQTEKFIAKALDMVDVLFVCVNATQNRKCVHVNGRRKTERTTE